jgi:hypothetical protein
MQAIGKKAKTYRKKMSKTKRAEGMANVIACLPSKHETEFKPQYHHHKE